jgi:hypothetical protein
MTHGYDHDQQPLDHQKQLTGNSETAVEQLLQITPSVHTGPCETDRDTTNQNHDVAITYHWQL